MSSSKRTSPSDAEALIFTGGKVFEKVFGDGMALVERTASYLDGPGRDLSGELPSEANLTYAAWSMELTTRLMQAASWLVMHRAVREGDMHPDEAMQKKYRITRDGPALDAAAQRGSGLPAVFLDLVEQCENLFERICRLDAALYADAPTGESRSVMAQLEKLQQAAETGAFDPLRVWGRRR
jgi:regulator of CtrA degradation